MNMQKKLIRKLFSTLLFAAMPLVGRYHSITRQKQFDDLVNKYQYSLVCFDMSKPYGDASREIRKAYKQSFKDLKDEVRYASKAQEYDDLLKRDTGFLVVDISSGRVEEVDEKYQIEQIPTCMLFKDGAPVGTILGNVQLTDRFSKSSILKFIEKHLGDDLEKLTKVRAQDRERSRQERIAYYNYHTAHYPYWYGPYYWGSYPGYYYPHGYYGYYGYGPHASFGFTI